MNNGKVRIYELSRELELENRDVLDLCEQENVAVKSHSSTITDEEADRIRSAAANYQKRSPAKKAVSAGKKEVKTKSADKPPVRKQQILEIRRGATAAPTPPKPARESVASKPTAAIPESKPAKPDSKPMSPTAYPPAPSALKKPPRSEDLVEPTAPKSATPPEVEPEPPTAPSEPPNDAATAISPPPAATAPKAEVEAPAAPAEPKPELISKPTLVKPDLAPKPAAEESPAAPAASSAGKADRQRPAKTVTKPISKRSDGTSKPPLEVRSISPGKGRLKSTATGEVETNGDKPSRPAKPARQVPELKGPPRPPRSVDAPASAKPSDSSDSDSEDDGFDESMGELLEKPTLRRPAPPKTSKRVEWEEDDEQERAASKVGKTTAKNKRRSQVILEDDDELAELTGADSGSDRPEPSQVSLSLARPAKPKSQQKPTTSRPAATTQRPKRSSGGSREDSRQSNRREQPDPKSLRPEIIALSTGLTVHELAEMMHVPETELIRALFFKGIAANINQTLDIPTATMVAEEFDIVVVTEDEEQAARKTTEMLDAADLDNLMRRPPVVTIMGHVDHGKTTLLDSIRKTKVAQGEAGGITQHIGAYHVDVGEGEAQKRIVFLDTPGHEAFTAMRARGTRVTDIAILVVAADDGVRPQTIEAISHARAAEVPIVVAINKIDKEGANPDRVKQELMEHNLVPEEWGGDTIMVPVSAIKGENLDDLLEMIALVSDVEDLSANPNRTARGTIIEAHLDKARGPVASLLVQNGTLRVGDSLVAGAVFGKVRAMIDDRGNRVDVAPPSSAVEVLGLNEVPAAGDEFQVYTDEREARSLADDRASDQRQSRLQQAMASRRVTLNSLSAQAQEGELKELNLILKADVQGSVEAILGSLQQLPQNEVQIRVLLAAPGEISETDVDLAAASSAVIVGFNTTLASGARRAADEAGVDVREYDIIYKLLEEIQGAMEGLLEPEMVEEPLGQVEVRAVFPVGRGAVAGCYVQSGKAIRNCRIRVRRGSEVVYEGNLDSLKRVKDDVKEVNAGFECGIGIDKFSSWEEGDIIETFRLVSKRRTLAMT